MTQEQYSVHPKEGRERRKKRTQNRWVMNTLKKKKEVLLLGNIKLGLAFFIPEEKSRHR